MRISFIQAVAARRPYRAVRLPVLLLSALLLIPPVAIAQEAAPQGRPPIPLRLQLKWTHQFQGAGFYVALERGYYAAEGLAVDILEGGPTIDSAARVIDGEAEFGVGSAGLLVERSKGRPVVALAALMQHSPFVLLTRRDGGPAHLHDLPGHRLMLETHAEELLAYLAVERVPLDRLTILPHQGSVDPLLSGEADALTAYTTSEPYDLRVAGLPYQLFSPRAAGIDFYGDTIFTSTAMLDDHPEQVAAFLRASLRGWQTALAEPEAAIDLIRQRYAPRLERERLRFEAAETRRLMMPDMVEIGYMHSGRWRHIAEGFAAAGLMPADFPLDGFLYAPAPASPPVWLHAAAAASLCLTLVFIIVLARFRRLNRQLRHEVAERTWLEAHFRTLASIDGLTGVPNRRAFMESATLALEAARKQVTALSVLMLDIDHFKAINDQFGHAAGDDSLIGFCTTARGCLGDQALLARLGGEEFAVLLQETDLPAAERLAERLRAATAAGLMNPDGPGLTVSVGVATWRGDESLDQLLIRADNALYAAKRGGRNRVVAAPP